MEFLLELQNVIHTAPLLKDIAYFLFFLFSMN